jgi:iduronate 2-sulfatase
MDRRSFLFTAAAPLFAAQQNGRKRNVLFIATDDLNNCLGCYGHPIVKTPNIDKIAKNGVRFDRAYCQFPLCSPSRTSLMTGLAPDTTKVYELQTHFRQVIPDVMTIGQAFRKNGYFSGRVGKIYHYGNPGQIGTDGLDDKPTWNQVVNPAGIDKLEEEPKLTNYTPNRGIGSAVCFYASSATDEQHTDGKVAAEVIKMMEAHKDEPFFIGAGFYRPHVPWIAPKKYFDMYPLEKIDVRPFDESEMNTAPEHAYFTKPANWGMSVEQRRNAIQAYYASISFVDAQIGKLLDALERLKLAENTTVVFWSDHGYQLGEHGQWMKQTVFEWSARAPFIVAGAGVSARGKNSMRTVEFLDMYPTLVEMCGLSGAPSDLHGKSVVPLLRNPNASWTKPAVSQVRRGNKEKMIHGHSLRNERYRYTMWGGGELGEELYDYETDPRELKNLATDSKSAALKARLKAELEGIVKARRRV